MSRILKRPMFRKGGSSNKGIMTGLVDRKQYGNGTGINKENLKSNQELFQSILEEATPKTRLPIGEFGLNLASGMTLTDALKSPYARFTKADDARKAAIGGGASKLAIGQALKDPKALTTKEARNTSDQPINGVLPGKTGFFTNNTILNSKGALAPIDKRMITLQDGRVMPYEEYKLENTKQSKATALGTQFNILGDLVKDMKGRLPDTPTSVVGLGYGVVEATADQFRQVAEQLGIKEGLVIKNEGVIDNFLKEKGFTEKATSAATMKASVINLGYALAKIAEPDNPRLSEGDIIRQLNRINFGASRKVFAGSLDQILKEELIRATREIESLKIGDAKNFLDFGTSKKTSTNTTGKNSVTNDTKFNPLGIPENRLAP
jgi:hypothetical protein